MARPDTGVNPYKNLAHNGESVGVHRAIAERVLGKPLPKGAVVHHIDDDGRNNINSNLVICPGQSYHRLIHLRQRALKESGNANYRLCRRCKKWDDPSNGMSIFKGAAAHKSCEAAHTRKMRKAGKWK